MKRISFFVASVLFASVLTGCPLLKKKNGDDPVDAATVSVSGTGAKNEKDILRYAQEEALDEVAVIGKDGAKARNFPGNGPEIANLAKGTVVKKMAKYFSTGVLVMFDDPVAGDGSKLMGWVAPNAFDVAAPKPVWTPPKIVDAGVKVDAGGGGTTVDAGGGGGKPDAGVATADAGGGGGGGGTDAGGGGGGGGGLVKPARGAVTTPAIGGKCPDGWAVTPSPGDGLCRMSCKTDAECTAQSRVTKCKPIGALKLCQSGN
jgi:hypothetical protein